MSIELSMCLFSPTKTSSSSALISGKIVSGYPSLCCRLFSSAMISWSYTFLPWTVISWFCWLLSWLELYILFISPKVRLRDIECENSWEISRQSSWTISSFSSSPFDSWSFSCSFLITKFSMIWFCCKLLNYICRCIKSCSLFVYSSIGPARPPVVVRPADIPVEESPLPAIAWLVLCI